MWWDCKLYSCQNTIAYSKHQMLKKSYHRRTKCYFSHKVLWDIRKMSFYLQDFNRVIRRFLLGAITRFFWVRKLATPRTCSFWVVQLKICPSILHLFVCLRIYLLTNRKKMYSILWVVNNLIHTCLDNSIEVLCIN